MANIVSSDQLSATKNPDQGIYIKYPLFHLDRGRWVLLVQSVASTWQRWIAFPCLQLMKAELLMCSNRWSSYLHHLRRLHTLSLVPNCFPSVHSPASTNIADTSQQGDDCCSVGHSLSSKWTSPHSVWIQCWDLRICFCHFGYCF